MQLVDVCSGIGGFSLSAHWAGIKTVQFCEMDNWCQKILNNHWPDVPIHDNLNTLTKEIITNNPLYEKDEPTILAGGIPCQPFSTAGKRKGEDDPRNLWPAFFRLCQELKPEYAFIENVGGLLSMEDGRTLEGIFTDLESEGYTVESFIIPACGVGAWHRRDRVWIIGYSEHHGQPTTKGRGDDQESSEQTGENKVRQSQGTDSIRPGIATDTNNILHTGQLDEGGDREATGRGEGENKQQERRGKDGQRLRDESGTSSEDVANPKCAGLQIPKDGKQQQPILNAKRGSLQTGEAKAATNSDSKRRCSRETWEQDASNARESPGCEGRDICNIKPGMGGVASGIPPWMDGYWDKEPEGIPRVAKGVKNRVNRLKGLGNAIVPQVALELFKVIKQHHENS